MLEATAEASQSLAATPDDELNNIMSFDIEDYYHIFYRNWLGKQIDPTEEVDHCTNQILDALAKYDCKATFFVVGLVAKKFPRLIRRIHEAGHEVGSHGHEHIYVKRITPDAFRNDLIESKKTLEEIVGVNVIGFRAPEFSIDSSTPWAFDILRELGFKYDSSLFPFSGSRYGDATIPQTPYEISTPHGPLLEMPMSTVSMGKRRVPVAGGGYLRYFPVSFNSWAIRKINQESRRAIVYMHPYEFEPSPKKIDFSQVSFRQKASAMMMHRKQLIGRKASLRKLECLLKSHRFSSFAREFKLA